MDYRIMIIAGSLSALILGIAVAYPLLAPDLHTATRIDIGVDVVYAYLGIQQFPSNIVGMWRNYSNPIEASYHIISYLVVLNITNNSDESARIRDFTVYVAPQITLGNETWVEQTGASEREQNASSDIGTSVQITNPIVEDIRHFEYFEGWDEIWQANSSRLIGLSGFTEVNDNAYPSLQSGDVYLYGKAQAEPTWVEGGKSSAYSLKHVQLQIVADNSLYSAFYNNLLRDDEYLGFGHGLDVYIHARR